MKGAAPNGVRHLYEFGPYRLDPVRRRLSREGNFVPLYPKAVEALILLVEHSGEVLPREALMEALWPDAIVEEQNLTVAIAHLRKVLGRNGNGISEFIQTIPRVGYRFVVQTREVEEPVSQLVERHATSTQPHIGGDGHENGSTTDAEMIAAEPTTSLPQPSRAAFQPGKLALALGALAVIALGAVVIWNGTRSTMAGPMRSIAVLPFQNLSEEKANALFADGVQDEILTDLAKIADLKVISRTSVMQYKSGAARNLRQIAKELGVAHVLEGNVQRAGNRVRVSAQLIDARTDAHLWAERYDREIGDVFSIQSEIAEKIALQLQARLSPSEKIAIERPPTTDLVAFDLYTRARELQYRTSFSSAGKANLLQAVELFNEAIARDPNFFLAYCQLALAQADLYLGTDDHTEARRQLAQAAVNQALRLRPEAGEAHLAAAIYFYNCHLDYDRARTELNIARRTLPNSSSVFEWMAYIDRRQGRWEDSARNFERALELDPRNFFILQQMSMSYENLQRYRDVAAVLDRALSIRPGDVETRVARAAADLRGSANPAPLHAAIQTILSERPDAGESIAYFWFNLCLCERNPSQARSALEAIPANGILADGVIFPRSWCEAIVAHIAGDENAARDAFTRARAETEHMMRSQPAYAPPICVLGMIDAMLGNKEQAISEGRRAVEMLPVAKDSIKGAYMIRYLAFIYAWTGEKDLAIERLTAALQARSDLSFGELRLHPYWDPLRGDPRFEKIVASLAPK